MTCPKDSNYYFEQQRMETKCCLRKFKAKSRVLDKNGMWECTRKKGHKGSHHAHKINKPHCVLHWTDEEMIIEAL